MTDKATHIFTSKISHGPYAGKVRIIECRSSPLEGSSRCNWIDEKVVGIVDTPGMAVAARDAHAKENNLEIAPF
jgi:hypothetical protein